MHVSINPTITCSQLKSGHRPKSPDWGRWLADYIYIIFIHNNVYVYFKKLNDVTRKSVDCNNEDAAWWFLPVGRFRRSEDLDGSHTWLTMMLFYFCLKPSIRETHTKSEKHQKTAMYKFSIKSWLQLYVMRNWCWQSSTLWPLAVLFLSGDSEKTHPWWEPIARWVFWNHKVYMWWCNDICTVYHFFHLHSF